MAKRPPLTATLTASSLENLKKQLLGYATKLDDKCEEFVKRLADIGIPIIEEKVSEAGFTYDEKGIMSGSNTDHETILKVDSLIGMTRATLTLQGKDILFIEFGAGVYHNEVDVGDSPHPKGKENGYLIGTYGAGHGSQKVWGYRADNGDPVLTHGTKATMPMYAASLEMRKKVLEIAKDVFGN